LAANAGVVCGQSAKYVHVIGLIPFKIYYNQFAHCTFPYKAILSSDITRNRRYVTEIFHSLT